MAPTTNMNLTLPVVSQTPGPEWASTINSDLSLIDAHDHTSTKGARIPSAALNINANINWSSYSPLQVGYVDFSTQTVALTGQPQKVYVVGGDLYYSNGAGTPVQITNGNSVAGSTGTITGLPSGTASASYIAGTSTFAFASATNTPAKMDVGPTTLRKNTANSVGITIQPSGSIASSWTLTLPAAPPASQSLLTIASNGTVSNATPNSTLTVTSSQIRVATTGITSNELATDAVTTIKILDGNVTQVKLGPRTINSSSAVVSASTTSTSTVAVSGLSVTTTLRSGYSYRVELIPTGAGPTAFQLNSGAAYDGNVDIVVVAPGPSTSTIAAVLLPWGGTYSSMPASAVSTVYTAGSSGSFTFRVEWYVDNSAAFLSLSNVKLIVYEL